MQRAVQRGLEPGRCRFPSASAWTRRRSSRHEYVTVVNDLDGHVLYVADGRGKEALEGFYKQFDREQLARVQTVAMDMWEPYIRVTIQHVPEGQEKIAFDKFHVAGHLGDAVDRVRRAEHRRLVGEDDQRLKGSRYRWLTNPENMDEERWEQFAELRSSALQTARAWGYKEHAMTLWGYRTRGWARKAWEAWYRSAIRCRLEPVKKVARMIKRHLDGILTAVVAKHQRARRVDQRRDPEGEVLSARVPQPQAIPQRHLLSPRRPRSLSRRCHPVTHSSTRDPEDPIARPAATAT